MPTINYQLIQLLKHIKNGMLEKDAIERYERWFMKVLDQKDRKINKLRDSRDLYKHQVQIVNTKSRDLRFWQKRVEKHIFKNLQFHQRKVPTSSG